ncbi:hypothetical protein CCUS01_01033, partial [Colletotrichum cuscutae]
TVDSAPEVLKFFRQTYFNSGGPVFESGSGRPLFFCIFLVYY